MESNPLTQPEKKPANFNPIADKWYDALLKKLPAGWKPDAKMFMYAGFGLLVFLGIIASSQTPQTSTESTKITPSTLPTLPPNIYSENPVSSKQFVSTKYQFSFSHPGLSEQCCFIIGPTHGNTESIGNLSNPASVRRGANAPFDGLSLYVIDLENTNPDDYLKTEAKNLKEQYRQTNGEEPKNASWQTMSIGSHSAVLLKNYSSLTVNRYYIQFPQRDKLLYIGASEEKLGSFNSALKTILDSLVFESSSTEK